MTAKIPYGRQDLSPEDIAAVVAVLKSDFLTQGPAIARFEKAVADYCGVKYAVAVSNATAALHLSCMAVGLGPGDSLWTSPNTFVASANCARYCGADVDFVDIDPRTYNLSVEALEKKLIRAKSEGRLPKVVVPVHFSGQPAEMAAIGELARKWGFSVIEDASHAIGARDGGQPVGACEHSDLSVFSFHPVKIVTTGEGGMILTQREDLYVRLMRDRTHGITRDPAFMQGPSEGPWYYQQIELGYNYRITDMQAALGASQLTRLDEFVRRRHFLAERYDRAFSDLPLITPWRRPDAHSAFHLYVIRLKLDQIRRHRRQVFEELHEKGILVNVHYIPVHLQPYYRALGFEPGDFPEAERYYAEAISLPMFPRLTDAEQDRVIEAVRSVVC